MPSIGGRPATVRICETIEAPAIAAMPATAGMQAVIHAKAVTPATSNSKDDINSMTATTAGMQATAGEATKRTPI